MHLKFWENTNGILLSPKVDTISSLFYIKGRVYSKSSIQYTAAVSKYSMVSIKSAVHIACWAKEIVRLIDYFYNFTEQYDLRETVHSK